MRRRTCLKTLASAALALSGFAAHAVPEDMPVVSGATDKVPAESKAAETSEHFDVVVVGSGLAGLTAALTARTAGAAKVAVFEKAPLVGGHSAFASGSIAFVDEKRQKPQGIEDSVDRFAADAREVGGDIDEELVRLMVDRSAEALDWLEGQGVRFAPVIFSAYGGRHRRCVTAYGNLGARRYIFELNRRCRSLGVQVRVMRRVTALRLLPGSWYAVDVTNTSDRSFTTVTASRVILATGGFGANLALRMKYRPELDENLTTTADPHGLMKDPATGDGLFLADRFGAERVNMDKMVLLPYWGGRMLDYSGAEIYVNREGRRFTDETAPTSKIARAISLLPARRMYVITDAKSVKGGNVGAKLAAGSVHRAESIEEMALGMDVPAANLRQTIAEYNAAVVSGKPDAFGRKLFMQTIETPPFYWGAERLMVHSTLGGLKVDERARVLDQDNMPVPGLYAAGEVAGGIWGEDRPGGAGLLTALVLGRIAGREAARSGKPVP